MAQIPFQKMDEKENLTLSGIHHPEREKSALRPTDQRKQVLQNRQCPAFVILREKKAHAGRQIRENNHFQAGQWHDLKKLKLCCNIFRVRAVLLVEQQGAKKEALKMKKMNVLLMGMVIMTAVTAAQLTGCGTGSSENAQTESSKTAQAESSENAQTESSADSGKSASEGGTGATDLPGGAMSADLTEGESATANGKTLKIVYVSNPSTGYSWKVSIDHPEVIREVADDYAQEKDDTGKSTDEVICGAGGYETFVFEGVGEGTAVITLDYAQQWNGGSEGMTRSVSVETDAQGNIVSVK